MRKRGARKEGREKDGKEEENGEGGRKNYKYLEEKKIVNGRLKVKSGKREIMKDGERRKKETG